MRSHAMLSVRNASYDIGGKSVLKGVNFTIEDKEKAGLIGANGVGKTTLLRVIMGIITPSIGSVSFSGKKTTIGYMPQTVAELDIPKDTTVLDFLLSGRPIEEIGRQMKGLSDRLAVLGDSQEQRLVLEKLGILQEKFENLGGYKAEDELLRIISGLQIEAIDMDARVSTLSGGERSKINFVRVLYSNSDVLLLDEPTNHLDKKSREWLIGFIKRFPGCALIISHDVSFLDSVVSKIVRLDEGSRSADVFRGNYTQHKSILAQRRLSLERVAANQEKEIDRLQEYLDRMQGVSGKKKRQAGSREKKLEKLKQDKIEIAPVTSTVHIKLSPKRKGGENPLVMRDVSYGYESNKKVLSHVSLTLSRNERLAIVGKNGAGKSTLLKLIIGFLSPQQGEIIIGSKTDLGYYAQEHEGINFKNTVLEEVSGISESPARNLRAVLASFLFHGSSVFQSVATLSPGERSRLALAKLSLYGSNMLLLDEPTNHLDGNTSSAIAHILREYKGTLIVVSHDIDFLEVLGVERTLILPQGEVTYYDRSIVERYRVSEG